MTAAFSILVRYIKRGVPNSHDCHFRPVCPLASLTECAGLPPAKSEMKGCWSVIDSRGISLLSKSNLNSAPRPSFLSGILGPGSLPTAWAASSFQGGESVCSVLEVAKNRLE